MDYNMQSQEVIKCIKFEEYNRSNKADQSFSIEYYYESMSKAMIIDAAVTVAAADTDDEDEDAVAWTTDPQIAVKN
uniref:Ovule protein n=1 Tax=Syphacia muris TaxID=451379 RepID=A0A0N5AB66_9BILA